jgi:hypothetical protein
MAAPITNADDLSLQTDIGYGTLSSGSTREFFKVGRVWLSDEFIKYNCNKIMSFVYIEH